MLLFLNIFIYDEVIINTERGHKSIIYPSYKQYELVSGPIPDN